MLVPGATRPSVRMARTTPRHYRKGDLGRCTGADVETDRGVHTVSLLFRQLHCVEDCFAALTGWLRVR
jgi:hypothetical protein